MEESKFTKEKNKPLFAFIIIELIVLFVIIIFSGLLPIFLTTKTTNVLPSPVVSPTKALAQNEITGWIAAWDSDKAQEVIPPVINNFNTFAPMLYRVMPDSSLGRHNIEERDYIVQQASQNNIPLAPVITDESDYTAISRLLGSETAQEKFIDQLINEAQAEGYAGWSIDIEQLKSKDKQVFSEFIKNTSIKLHENDLKLFVIVYGRVEKETYDPALAHDYKTLGKYADQVQLMTYNYNNSQSDPGGQTPLAWYRSVLDFATSSIPAEKILIGLSTHGYDWVEDDEVKGLNYQDARDIIELNNSEVKYDSKNSSQVSNFTDSQGKEHSVWYEDAKTIEEKMNIAQNEFGINKFALWRLSAEDPTVWDEISNLNTN